MSYSAVGLLAVIIHLIINYDVFRKRAGGTFPGIRYYRQFLLSVIVYHITDSLWGFFNNHHMPLALLINTSLYFTMMALSIMFWTFFVVHYLEEKSIFCSAINYIGKFFFIFQISIVAANFFVPILFSIDSNGHYQKLFFRNVLFFLQIAFLLVTSLYTLIITAKAQVSIKRRHLTIGLFGLAMILAITAQIFFVDLPFYSIGYLIGCCLLHTFVVEEERADNIFALKESFSREAMQIEELGATKTLAYTDPMTGVKSKRAYLDTRKQLEQKITNNTIKEFAIAVFDVNGLKEINDHFGHEVGDQHIINASTIICNTLKHSPVFRIGGDEFVAILEGGDFEERRALISDFNSQMEENSRTGKVVVSVGLATYRQNGGNDFTGVFNQADENMYKRKAILKSMK